MIPHRSHPPRDSGATNRRPLPFVRHCACADPVIRQDALNGGLFCRRCLTPYPRETVVSRLPWVPEHQLVHRYAPRRNRRVAP